MIKGKKIFITGGCGFIGTHLVNRLIEKNQITIYDNYRRNALQFFSQKGSSNLTIIKADILDKQKLAKAVKGHEIILHLAAMAGVSDYYAQPVNTMLVNMIGTANLMAALADIEYERFIYFSTSEVYGAFALDAKEDGNTVQGDLKQARWTYSISKLAGEHFCFAHQKEKNSPIVSIRPFNIYGPGQIGEGGIQTFVPLALKNQTIKVTGDGKQIRAWCYIDDFIAGVYAALTAEKIEGETFNIGNSEGISILELAQKIIEVAGSQSKIEFIPHPGVDVIQRTPNIEKAKKMLHFQPKIDLIEGLQKTIPWYQEHLSLF